MVDSSGDATWLNRITGGTNLPEADLTRVELDKAGTNVRFKLSVGDAKRFEDAVNAVPSRRAARSVLIPGRAKMAMVSRTAPSRTRFFRRP
ncbi:hypothetical protein ACIBAG_35880 [Streptomyces sp. NPDC051243]|uniref:hypothetical protein n=1 Tax=Streptomyces sp. NPDC051243 TaxID=3365646 RepID=UPI0037A4A4FD